MSFVVVLVVCLSLVTSIRAHQASTGQPHAPACISLALRAEFPHGFPPGYPSGDTPDQSASLWNMPTCPAAVR